jgi:acyl-CoA thioester hydrolase
MSNDELKLPVELKLRIDWSELDLFGHVNNVSFVKYVQAARIHYWEHIGLYQHFLQTKVGPMLVSVSCQYKKPLFFPGNVTIKTGMRFIGNTSFGLQHMIYDDTGALCAEAEDVMVMYDFNNEEKVPFSGDLRKNAEALEGREFI